jgi:hypothetical protein
MFMKQFHAQSVMLLTISVKEVLSPYGKVEIYGKIYENENIGIFEWRFKSYMVHFC